MKSDWLVLTGLF